MEWLFFTVLLVVWAADGLRQAHGLHISSSTTCPSWEENPWCSCYHFDDGVFLECSMVSLGRVARVLGLVQYPIKSLSIYDLDGNVTSLPPGIFGKTSGVSSLQVSHSNLQNIAEGSFFGLESSLQSLTIMHSQLSVVPKAALQKLSRLRSLDLEANNITELQSFSFFNMNLVSINLKANDLRLISEYAFEGLEESLEELNLMNNKLKQLPIPALRRLSKLHTLKATWNHISNVVSDGYSRLPALRVLDLSNNHFAQLTSSSLATMPALVSLSLYTNVITTVAGDSFIQNSGLQTLYMSHNGIMSLPPETFSYTMFIRVIELGDNHLHSISNGLFTNLPELQEVFLTNNNILKISNQTFANSTKISVLYLQNNEIQSLESGAFAGMPLLFNLQLSSNKLTEIPKGLFSSSRTLNSLSLDHNKITRLAEGTFAHLSELSELRLQNNRLSRVEKGVFSSLPNLLELHLQNNVIDFIAKEAFSSLGKLQHLNLEDNRLTELPDALSQYPANLITLRFSKNLISHIHMDAFRGQSKLEIFWLNDNNITSIEKVLLYDLSFVQELYLENNQINNIQDRCFQNMHDLELLSLSNNNMQQVTPLHFEGLESLKKLYLNNNKISDIKPQTFQKLTSLQELNLSNNRLSVIRRYVFQGSIPIRTLSLEASSIVEIDPFAFTELQHLEELNLRGNVLAHLNRLSLNIHNIRKLDLAQNKFEIIEEDSLYGLLNLDSLDLSGCGFPRLPPHFLAEATELRSLSLAKNNFRSFHSAFFQKLLSLRKVDLSFNDLNNSILSSLEGLPKLECLRLDGNPLGELRRPITGLPNLREISLSKTQIYRMDNTVFTPLKQLKTLDLSHNNLREIPPGIFTDLIIETVVLADNSFTKVPNAFFLDDMSALRVLDMSGNPMKRITGPLASSGPPLAFLEELKAARTNLTLLTSQDLQQMPSLQYLNLAQAGITKISPGSFRNVTHLTHLNLAFNRLQVLPRERLRGLKDLSLLNLTGNILKKLEQLPSGSHSMKVLDASRNMLTSLIQSTFKHGEGIERLYLGSNWITTIHPRAFEPLMSLKYLDLSENYLEQLDTVVLEPIERSLETLQLYGNPWNCGCAVSGLWTWLQDHLSYVPDPAAPVCHLPKVLNGRSFLLVPSSSLCPQPLIIRLAVRDIQSHSLVVSWQAANSSDIYGFKVSYRETTSDGRVVGGLKTRSLPASTPTTHQVGGLRPSTSYLVCVHALTRTPTPTAATHELQNHIHLPPDMATKCVRVKTQEAPPAEIVLNNRLAIMIGSSLGITIFLVGGTIICCCQMCKDRREAAKQETNGTKDYLSYRQFSVQGNEANTHEPYTEC